MGLELEQGGEARLGISGEPAPDRIPVHCQQRSHLLAGGGLAGFQPVEHLQAGLIPGFVLGLQPGAQRGHTLVNPAESLDTSFDPTPACTFCLLWPIF